MIIELYWNRNEQAITETDKKYNRYCFSVANNILENNEDSEECVNETWLKSWNAIPPCRPDKLRLFLAKITRNLSLDRFRRKNSVKRGSGQMVLALDELCDCVSDRSDVESRLSSEELAKTVNSFLQALTKRECDIFIRRYFFVEPTDKIANRYLIKESHVLVILSRTRAKLKAWLEDAGYFV